MKSFYVWIEAVTLSLVLPAAAQLANPEYYSLYQETAAGNETRLIDSDGTLLHSWANGLAAPSGSTAYLREDGLLQRSGQRGNGGGGFLAGSFGTLQLVEWEGDVVWEFDLQVSGDRTLHHDVKPMPNGNVLATVWDFFPAAEIEALGWTPVAGGNGVWMERLIEIEPNLVTGSAEIVWEWSLSNHLIQDADSSATNFGDVAATPGKIDINFNSGITSGDYFHISGIDYNPERDEIVLCPNNIDELWVIDHSTTTAEAATSTGGNRGKGGQIIYRWGNPAVYDFGGGAESPKFLERAHDPRWLRCPESGIWQITVHNNDRVDADPGDSDSQVLELDLPIDEDGDYVLAAAGTFGPAAPRVLYEVDPTNDFFRTPFMGGAQKLRNGNILITLATIPRLVEVDSTGAIVWEETLPGGGFVFKAQNYPINYSGYGPSLPVNYDVWKTAHFGFGNVLGSDPTDDADEDGAVNLLEYYLGNNPRSGARSGEFSAEIEGAVDSKVLSVKFTRRSYVPDVNGKVEFSRNLASWLSEDESRIIRESVKTCADGLETVEWEIETAEGDMRDFVRLAVEQIE